VTGDLKASDFASITREDGKKQTTYKGMPLYYFARDAASGDTKGDGAREAVRGTAERPRRDADQRSSDRAFTASDLHVSPMPGRFGTHARPSWTCSGSSRIASAQSTYSR
jgi:hypothetical protein